MFITYFFKGSLRRDQRQMNSIGLNVVKGKICVFLRIPLEVIYGCYGSELPSEDKGGEPRLKTC